MCGGVWVAVQKLCLITSTGPAAAGPWGFELVFVSLCAPGVPSETREESVSTSLSLRVTEGKWGRLRAPPESQRLCLQGGWGFACKEARAEPPPLYPLPRSTTSSGTCGASSAPCAARRCDSRTAATSRTRRSSARWTTSGRLRPPGRQCRRRQAGRTGKPSMRRVVSGSGAPEPARSALLGRRANPAGSQRHELGAPGFAPVPAPVWPEIRLLFLRPTRFPSRVWLCLRSCLNLRLQFPCPAPRLSSDVPALAPTRSDPSLDRAASPVRSGLGFNPTPTPATPASLPERDPELGSRLARL